jgi:CHAD domain-containing protein
MPQPVTVFLLQSLKLRAAYAACLDKPTPKAVRHLRSASRRLDATMELLSVNAGIPVLPASSKPLRRSLRKIQRAAGKVRDLDVHRELLSAYNANTEAASLDTQLQRARDEAANKLQKRLLKADHKLEHRLDDLEVALRPSLDLDLSGAELAGFARSWFATSVRKLDVEQEDQLHAIRKASKTARYLAENGASVSKAAVAVAARFEQVQQTLGAWHDHRLLLDEAKASLNGGSPLVKKIDADCRRLKQQASLAAERLLKNSGKQHRRPASGKRKKSDARRPASA